MTDFISRLEDELLDAARRRSAHGRRRRALPRLRLAPVVTATTVVLLAAVVVLAARGLDRTSDDVPAPPGGGTPVTLAAAVPAAECAGREPRVSEAVPESPLDVVGRRSLDPVDEVPRAGGGFSWIPAETVYPNGSRIAGPGHFSMEVRLLPVAGLRADCDAPRGAADGMCLIAGSRDVSLRCFDYAAIGRGEAIALTGPGVAYGIVPDGVDRVRVEWDGGAASAEAMDNAYELRAPGLREGAEVRVRFESGPVPSVCGPSDAALTAVPLLAREATGAPPEPVVEAMRDAGARSAWRDYARAIEGGDGLQIWAMPDLPCDNPRVEAERVCIVLVGDDVNRGFFCARPRDIAARGAWFPFPDEDGRTGVAGMAPTGTAGVATALQGGQSTTIPLAGGVFAAVLPAGEGEIEVRFADGPDPTILDGTGVDGLVDEIGERLPGGEVLRYTEREFEHTTVYYGHEDARPVAEHIAGVLRVDRVEPMPDEVAGLPVDGGLAVVVGRDLTRPRPDDVGVLEASGDVSPEVAERIRERLALGSPLHLFPTDEHRARSVVRYAPGWGISAHEIAERLGIDALEAAGEVTPDERLGTPIVVVLGSDLSG